MPLHARSRVHVTPNKRTIEAYMDGFRKTDRPQILSCLTDDVEWVIPGAFDVRGKDDFAKHIVDEGFVGHPVITVSRLLEADDVVVAEGSVRAPKKDGAFLWRLRGRSNYLCQKLGLTSDLSWSCVSSNSNRMRRCNRGYFERSRYVA